MFSNTILSELKGPNLGYFTTGHRAHSAGPYCCNGKLKILFHCITTVGPPQGWLDGIQLRYPRIHTIQVFNKKGI